MRAHRVRPAHFQILCLPHTDPVTSARPALLGLSFIPAVWRQRHLATATWGAAGAGGTLSREVRREPGEGAAASRGGGSAGAGETAGTPARSHCRTQSQSRQGEERRRPPLPAADVPLTDQRQAQARLPVKAQPPGTAGRAKRDLEGRTPSPPHSSVTVPPEEVEGCDLARLPVSPSAVITVNFLSFWA